MSQMIDLYDYWDSYKKGNPDQSIASRIKQNLQNRQLNASLVLNFVCSVAAELNFNSQSVDDAMEMYVAFGLDEFEDCALPVEVLRELIEEAKQFNLDGTDTLINANTIWTIFQSVDDENPFKKSILHYMFDNIAFYGLYNSIDIVEQYLDYVHHHNGYLISIPIVIAKLLH